MSTTENPVVEPQQANDTNNSTKQAENTTTSTQPQQQQNKRHRRPRIEFETLPDTEQELRDMIDELKKAQGDKPEVAQRQKRIDDIEKKIVKEQEHIAKLKERIFTKPKDIGHNEDAMKKLQAEIDGLSEQISELSGEDKKVRNQEKHALDVFRSLINAKKDFVENHFVAKCHSLEAIENRLEKLKFEQSTQTHSNKRERELVSDISKLELSKKSLPQLDKYDQNIDLAKKKLEQIRTMSRNKKELDALYDARREKVAKKKTLFEKIKDKRSKKQKDYDALQEKRDLVGNLIREKKESQKEFRVQGKEYYDNEHKIRACTAKIDWLKRQAERQRRKEEKEARLAKIRELERQQKEEEERQRKQEEEARLAEKRAEQETKLRNPHADNISMLKPLISYLKTLNQKKGRRQRGKKIQHSIDKISLFSQLDVDMPTKKDQIAPTIDLLQKKLEEYEADIIGPDVPMEEVRKIRGVPEPTEEETKEEENIEGENNDEEETEE